VGLAVGGGLGGLAVGPVGLPGQNHTPAKMKGNKLVNIKGSSKLSSIDMLDSGKEI
jgi:hypothetical protein